MQRITFEGYIQIRGTTDKLGPWPLLTSSSTSILASIAQWRESNADVSTAAGKGKLLAVYKFNPINSQIENVKIDLTQTWAEQGFEAGQKILVVFQ